MKKIFLIVCSIVPALAFAWAQKEATVHQTAGFQTAENAKFTRVGFNAVDVNAGGAWQSDTQQWCPGVTGSADISASVLWIDKADGSALPDGGVTEIFIMRSTGKTAGASEYSGSTLVTTPLWGFHDAFAGPGNQGISITRQSIYVDNANYCYSIAVFQWTGYNLRMTNNWPEVTWASFRMNP